MIELENINPYSVVVIGGPTASGKSGLALDIAKRYNGEIINADSMQVYAGTPIISAVPSMAERAEIPHHLYEIYAPSVNGTVVDWLDRAVETIREIWSREKLPVVVGGTGMYLDNLINGTTPIPEPERDVRAYVAEILQKEGQEGLYARLELEDAQAAAMLNPNDATRVRRAYEIFLQTRMSIAQWYQMPMLKKLPDADFRVLKIIPETTELDERCYRRFDIMMQDGALDEVRNMLLLKLDKNLPAMKMLGVPELMAYLEGEISLDEAIYLAKLHTRQYAKRQRTWFRNKLKAEVEISQCFAE